MSKECAFTIYNASAGSGKTYTLVMEYLKILCKSKSNLAFKNILALTFTNKAVAEMKERIVKMLMQFSDEQILSSSNPMFEELQKVLNMDALSLHQKSKHILLNIAHNYASFDVSTIDKFNHRLIRTFAYDLKLPLNFEVELDTINLLHKAVDKLIDKAGTNKDLTKVLVDFAIEKADNDKSWDVSYDFNNIAQLLISENDVRFIDSLKVKTLEDFKELKSQLTKTMTLLESKLINTARETLELIVNYGLQFNDFSSGYLPKYFQKLVDGSFDVNFGLKWQEDLEDGSTLYPKRVSSETAALIDSIQPKLLENFNQTKQQVIQYKFVKNVLNNITPLSVLNEINTSLQELKDEDDLLLISEFNALISREIKNQPAPYIYERIGEKFKNYFIDEFQDTSTMQWQNMIPLIGNALSGENFKGESGSAMIVGDAKQAIYRWRGGKAEQFIDLYTDGNPFYIEKCVKNLPANYRSSKQVVNFNNSFFKHLSSFVFSNSEHQAIYEASKQDSTVDADGFVEISFLDVKNLEENDSKDLLHCQKTLENIQEAQQKGFDLKDICVITRKSKEGIAIAEYLSSHQIPIVSSESLLLKNSPEIGFISAIIGLSTQPENEQLKIEVLSYLAEFKLQLEDKHSFYNGLYRLEVNSMFAALALHHFYFDFNKFLKSPIYEAVENIIRSFKLNDASNAYLQFYLDEVLDYSQRHNSSLLGFINHWDKKKDKLSVVSPQANNAVQIMTIHKSKGLEFPVVIFPYANQEIYFDMSPKTWFPVSEDDFSGFSNLFINLNKDLEEFGELGFSIYSNYRSELELDSINLLYVVLTRAVEQLYVISELDLDAKQNEKLNLYSGLFINYLKSINQWNNLENTYIFGNPERQLSSKESKTAVTQKEFICTPKESHNLNIVTNSGYLWDTAQEKAQEKGNLVHNIMSQIHTVSDAPFVMDEFVSSGKLNEEQFEELSKAIAQIVEGDNLKQFFADDLIIYNERDIITKEGIILRPDRIVVTQNRETAIIDYKTGNEKPSHFQQLLSYQSVLEEMGFNVTKKILIYINEDIQIKEF
ncbi:UvrD-helicase domain-containing protein [Subsaxibacter sp. CAU 1640]|uniref:UvrD-helicase domain-containing protein n=1 Tax=Subsaxibacter sp. CAU 1640 TaxID=2933271 RepID=UPI002004026C|nr:UvrD-helicase domain-containing protein [Subsaxibacter sp. CAU 1640]MCK7589403.1 UvrD-helicase domain-containing protein [Subsaxibacter sp. CAU 1640]